MVLIDKLNSLLNGLRVAVRNLGKQEAAKSWGYGSCKTGIDETAEEFKHVLHLLRNQELSAGVCICPEELKNIESTVHRILGPDCKTSEPGFRKGERDAQWVLNNPDCVSYETWADYLYAQCKKVGIDFKVYLNKCKQLDIDIKVVNDKLCDLVDLKVLVEKKLCPVDVSIKIDKQQCQLDFKTLVTETKCDITFDTYVHAIQCGLDVNIIADILKCGATIKVVGNTTDVCFPATPAPICATHIYCTALLPCSTFDGCICGQGGEPPIGCQENYRFFGFPTIKTSGCVGCDLLVGIEQWASTELEYIEVDGSIIRRTFSSSCLSGCVGLCDISGTACTDACDNISISCYDACAGNPACEAICDSARTACYNDCAAAYDACFTTCAGLSDIEYTVSVTMTRAPEGDVECFEQGGITTDVKAIMYNGVIEDSLGNIKTCVVYDYDVQC